MAEAIGAHRVGGGYGLRTVQDLASSGRLKGPSAAAARRGLSLRLVAGTVLTFLLTAFAWTGEAGACPLTNPSCALEDVQKTVGDVQKTVDDTVDKVEDTAKDVTDTVEDTASGTIDEVEDKVGDVTDTVDDTTDQILNPTNPTTPTKPTPRGGPDKPGNPNNHPGSRDDKPKDRVQGRDQTREGRRGERSEVENGLQGLRDPRLATNFSREPGTAEGADSISAMTRPELEGFGRAALDAAKKFAFPLLMTLAVGAFLLVQSRVDRRDPKLALAPIDHDMLAFE